MWEELVRCSSGGTESSTWDEVKREWKRLEGIEEGLGEDRICFPFSLSFCFARFTAFLHMIVWNFSAFMQTSMCVFSFCLYGFAKGGAVQKAFSNPWGEAASILKRCGSRGMGRGW